MSNERGTATTARVEKHGDTWILEVKRTGLKGLRVQSRDELTEIAVRQIDHASYRIPRVVERAISNGNGFDNSRGIGGLLESLRRRLRAGDQREDSGACDGHANPISLVIAWEGDANIALGQLLGAVGSFCSRLSRHLAFAAADRSRTGHRGDNGISNKLRLAPLRHLHVVLHGMVDILVFDWEGFISSDLAITVLPDENRKTHTHQLHWIFPVDITYV
mmetsp:Transcript_6229/g.19992  ORF Transcript_6229/g.19992 Transcript_6229/m.19992 type:complete len:219 (-) Transcript_6229:142-798(-)